jgi:hypothetical protein
VSCGFAREKLALHVEGDLPAGDATLVSSHLGTCDACRRFFEALRARQAMLKSLRRETVSASECAGMRRGVMTIINDRQAHSGWLLRLERAVVLGFRQRSYALAAFAFLGIVSASVLANMRHAPLGSTPGAGMPVTFVGHDTLVRPDGYRDWMVVVPSTAAHQAGCGHASTSAGTPGHRIYINPSGYREYAKSGKFPEGTMMVWEESSVVLASVKDSTRFEGGWGFFDFTSAKGGATSRATALPESSGCRACHQRDAQTDHVFTQFYPALRSARLELTGALPWG